MAAFKSWLIKNHAAYCNYCGYDVDQDGNKGQTLLHPPGMNGPSLEIHLTQYDIKHLHPVVCKDCWGKMNSGKYPGRTPQATRPANNSVSGSAVTKMYVPKSAA